MSVLQTVAKVAFWLGIAFAILGLLNVARGTATIFATAIFVVPLVLPYLYLVFNEGRNEAASPAEPAE